MYSEEHCINGTHLSYYAIRHPAEIEPDDCNKLDRSKSVTNPYNMSLPKLVAACHYNPVLQILPELVIQVITWTSNPVLHVYWYHFSFAENCSNPYGRSVRRSVGANVFDSNNSSW